MKIPTKWEIALGFSTLVFIGLSLFGLYRYEQLRHELKLWQQPCYIEEAK